MTRDKLWRKSYLFFFTLLLLCPLSISFLSLGVFIFAFSLTFFRFLQCLSHARKLLVDKFILPSMYWKYLTKWWNKLGTPVCPRLMLRKYWSSYLTLLNTNEKRSISMWARTPSLCGSFMIFTKRAAKSATSLYPYRSTIMDSRWR